jgi:hypothetical protein
MRRVLISVQNLPSYESLNDLPTTGKWTEYMAFKLPVAAVDLHEYMLAPVTSTFASGPAFATAPRPSACSLTTRQDVLA